MAIGKAKASRFVRRAMQTPAQQTETGNVRSRGGHPITEAIIRMLNRKVPNDPVRLGERLPASSSLLTSTTLFARVGLQVGWRRSSLFDPITIAVRRNYKTN
jgi:hypothetical protein